MTDVLSPSMPSNYRLCQAQSCTLLAGWHEFACSGETPAATGIHAGRAVLDHGQSTVERLSHGLIVHHPYPGSQCPRIDLERAGLSSGSFILAMSVDRVGADWQPTGRVAHLFTVESDGFFLYRHLLGAGVADMTDVNAAFLGTQYAGGNDGAFYYTSIDLIRPLHLIAYYDAPSATLSLFSSPSPLGDTPQDQWKKLNFLGARTLDLRFDGAEFQYKTLSLGGWHDGSCPLSMTVRHLQLFRVDD